VCIDVNGVPLFEKREEKEGAKITKVGSKIHISTICKK
jgi:hypothetical protein